jgi:hypothetical protein
MRFARSAMPSPVALCGFSAALGVNLCLLSQPSRSMSRVARRPDGRCPQAEESPGSTGIRCRLTAGGGDPRDSATENKPPAQAPRGSPRARAKRCGKSAPRPWQQGRQGKPHREQDRIGAAVPQGTGASRSAARVGRARRAARRVQEEWSSRAPRQRGVRTEPGLQAVWHSCARADASRVMRRWTCPQSYPHCERNRNQPVILLALFRISSG